MEKTNSWAAACIHVMQKPLFAEETELFASLCNYQQEISAYLSKIGLELVLNRDLGYAFIRQFDAPEGDGDTLPKLIRRIPVTFEQSLVLVILYDELEKFDGNGSDTPFCIINEEQVRELAQACWPGANTDQTKFQDTIAKALSDLSEQGLIRERRPQGMSDQESELYKSNRRYELRNIIRARVTKDFFVEFKRRLEELADNGEPSDSLQRRIVETTPRETQEETFSLDDELSVDDIDESAFEAILPTLDEMSMTTETRATDTKEEAAESTMGASAPLFQSIATAGDLDGAPSDGSNEFDGTPDGKPDENMDNGDKREVRDGE